jgi:hypothetical protein
MLKSKKSTSLKVWSQTHKLIEAIYDLDYVPEMDIVLKIERNLLEKQYQSFVGHYDSLIHENIRKLNNLEKLESSSVAKQAQESTSSILKFMKEISEVLPKRLYIISYRLARNGCLLKFTKRRY